MSSLLFSSRARCSLDDVPRWPQWRSAATDSCSDSRRCLGTVHFSLAIRSWTSARSVRWAAWVRRSTCKLHQGTIVRHKFYPQQFHSWTGCWSNWPTAHSEQQTTPAKKRPWGTEFVWKTFKLFYKSMRRLGFQHGQNCQNGQRFRSCPILRYALRFYCGNWWLIWIRMRDGNKNYPYNLKSNTCIEAKSKRNCYQPLTLIPDSTTTPRRIILVLPPQAKPMSHVRLGPHSSRLYPAKKGISRADKNPKAANISSSC